MTDLEGADEEPPKPVDSSGRDLHLLNSLRMRGDGDEEELQMLASLKREQEEDECRAPGLSASQIHQCNVSISMSCGDASTWTYVSMVCAIHLIYTLDLLLLVFFFCSHHRHLHAAHLYTIISSVVPLFTHHLE